MDLGHWLRTLGLEQYEAAFREQKIDDTVLPSLTAEDLKELGVGFVGHRRKLLDALAALRTEARAPTPLSDAPAAIESARGTVRHQRKGRMWVTCHIRARKSMRHRTPTWRKRLIIDSSLTPRGGFS